MYDITMDLSTSSRPSSMYDITMDLSQSSWPLLHTVGVSCTNAAQNVKPSEQQLLACSSIKDC